MMTADRLSKRLSKCLSRLPAILGCLSKRLSKVAETGEQFRETRCGSRRPSVRDNKNKDNNKPLYRGAPFGGAPFVLRGGLRRVS